MATTAAGDGSGDGPVIGPGDGPDDGSGWEETRPAGAEEGGVVTGQVVPRNRWDELVVPELGAWTPQRTLSVVVPYYQAREALELTLTALAAQTYPAHLTQVVVADDGSHPPLELAGDHLGLDVTVVRQDDLGFRLAAARNLGAEAADGDVLVFLDGDMLAEPEHLEAHARWHHVCDHAVTLGFRRHVDVTGVTADDVAAAARDGGLATLFAEHDHTVPAWLERHMTRMAELTSDDDDLFRAVTGGNLGVRAEVFDAVGGFDADFTQWGSEDTDLGQRLFTAGALLVPERRAACWHQGDSRGLEPHERASLAEQRARLSHLVPHPHFRRLAPGRTFTVPRVVVEVACAEAAEPTVTATVESVLAGDLPDVEVLLDLPDDHPQRVLITRLWEGDARVHLAARPLHARTPYRVRLPAGAALGPTTLDAVVWQLCNPDDPLGVLHVTLPDEPPSRRSMTAVATRAIGRAVWAEGTGDERGDDDAALRRAAELFGGRWLSGASIGVSWAPVEELTGIVRRRVRPRAVEAPDGSSAAPSQAGSASAPASSAADPGVTQGAAAGDGRQAGDERRGTDGRGVAEPDRRRGGAGGASRQAVGRGALRRVVLRLRRVAITTLPAPAVDVARRVKRRVTR